MKIIKWIKRVILSPIFVPSIIIASLAILFVAIATLPTNNPINDQNSLPPDITISYRTVENTGFLGSAAYFLFDSAGNRYYVSQELFDSYKDLPRK